MFITRATRHDKADLEEFFESAKWENPILGKGVGFIARDGAIVGSVRLIEVEPQTLVLEDVLVREDRRGEGIGKRLIQTAMNSRGGTIYVCCHDDRISFYEDLGFTRLEFTEIPGSARLFYEENGSAPDKLPPDHVHYFLRAR